MSLLQKSKLSIYILPEKGLGKFMEKYPEKGRNKKERTQKKGDFMWTKGVDIYAVKEIRTRTDILFGIGALGCMEELLKELAQRKIKDILILTGSSGARKSGAWQQIRDLLEEQKFSWYLYDKIPPHPSDCCVDEAVKAGRESGAKAVIAIGGGSVLDAAKCVSVLLTEPDQKCISLADGTFPGEKNLPLIAINLTHGSGSENNAFAMILFRENREKRVLYSPLFYPWKVICDPMLTVSLSPEQTRYVTMEAVNHALESSVSSRANPFSIMLAHEIIKLTAKYLPAAEKEKNDLEARYFLLYASLLAGLASDNGSSHFAQILAHPLAALKPDLPHGLGLSILMPAVLKKMYPENAHVLAAVLSPIVPDLTGSAEESDDAAAGLETWLSSYGIPQNLQKVGFLRENIDELVNMSYEMSSLSQLLSVSPVECSREAIQSIFDEVLTPSGQKK